MGIILPKERNFIVKAGTYRATLIQIIPLSNKKTETPYEQLRFIFFISSLSSKTSETVAAKTFDENISRRSPLRSFLECWLGKGFLDQHQEKTEFDVNALIGREADLRVNTYANPPHPHPYSFIEAIAPPGSFLPYKDSGQDILTPGAHISYKDTGESI